MGRRKQTVEPLGDEIHLRGCIQIQLQNAFNGEPIGERIKLNTVVTAGRRWVLEKIGSFSNQTNSINAIAVGTGTAAPTTADTALASEVTVAASTGRMTIGTFTTTNLTSNPPSWEASVLFGTAQVNTTLGEAGLFNTSAATAGTMLSRVTFSTINKANTNTLAVTYTISN